MSAVAEDPPTTDAVVVGAGVIGLTTGICLAEAGISTRIVTAEMLERTTSYAAGAICGPVFLRPEDRVGAWEHVGFDEFTALAADPGTGVRLCDGVFVAPAEMPGPPPIFRPADVRTLGADQVPPGYGSGFVARIPCVDMPSYLNYLTERFQAAGGVIENRRLNLLQEAAEIAPLAANCSGLGARQLVPDFTVRPVRGQQVVIENPGIETVFMEPPFGPAWVGIVPHGDLVVLGGIAVEDDWNLDPDPQVAREILRRCAAADARLSDARVVEHRVGLRPGRPSVRLEREQIDSTVVVHDYGHGGSGVLQSWGCARDAVRLLTA